MTEREDILKTLNHWIALRWLKYPDKGLSDPERMGYADCLLDLEELLAQL